MSQQRKEEIRKFLASGHPHSAGMAQWSEQIRALGPDVPEVCIDTLAHGEFDHAPAAIYGLRVFGYEAWGEGYWEDEHYRIRAPGASEWQIIHRTIKMKNPYVA